MNVITSQARTSQTRVIDLGELRHQDEFPLYAAVYGPAEAGAFVLSPAAMRWSEGIHLNRLEDCRSFWLAQKKKLRCKLTDLFDPLLRHHYGDGYVAVFADHPWQCLLYLHYQLRHGARGLFLLNSRLNQNIYKSLDWDCWFSAQDSLAGHLLEARVRGFSRDSFGARQARFRRFIQRIGVSRPDAMKAAEVNSITRRFGKQLGLIWQWSFTRNSGLEGFPWISLAQGQVPGVNRELDYPLNQWACIEVLLREDFSRLCEQLQRNESEHINRMLWQVTLFNYEHVSVELSFRHPYSLHRDSPDFATALYQARYIFDDLMRKLQTRERDLDLPDCMPFIGWRLEICERILLAPALWELFANEFDDIDYQQIMQLQNKLPTAFECYQTNASFFPEESFRGTAIGAQRPTDFDSLQWSGSASNKPLFYYPDARAIEHPGKLRKIFLERNASQWWLGEDALRSIRDYFIVKDRQGRCSWAYRDTDGEWFLHGEYC